MCVCIHTNHIHIYHMCIQVIGVADHPFILCVYHWNTQIPDVGQILPSKPVLVQKLIWRCLKMGYCS